MQPWDLLASDAVKGFIEEALSRKYDALQVSTALHKAGYSNEDRIVIMDYMALVPKFREKFFARESAKRECQRHVPSVRQTRIGAEHRARYRALESKPLAK